MLDTAILSQQLESYDLYGLKLTSISGVRGAKGMDRGRRLLVCVARQWGKITTKELDQRLRRIRR